MRQQWSLLVIGLGLSLFPGLAQAHLVNSGLGPFYDGILHLFLSPMDILGLLALSFLAGFQGKACARKMVVVLPLSWLAGGLLGWRLFSIGDPTVVVLLLVAVLALLVALEARTPPLLVVFLATAFGGLQGWMSGSALASLESGSTSFLGVIATVFLLVLMMTALVASLQAFWARVVVRVAGSWIVAICLLMLGWSFRGAV